MDNDFVTDQRLSAPPTFVRSDQSVMLANVDEDLVNYQISSTSPVVADQGPLVND